MKLHEYFRRFIEIMKQSPDMMGMLVLVIYSSRETKALKYEAESRYDGDVSASHIQ
jgi:hypothetical protein